LTNAEIKVSREPPNNRLKLTARLVFRRAPAADAGTLGVSETKHTIIPVVVMLLFGLVCGNGVLAETTAPQKQAVDLDMKKVERGRYLTRITGCNDCHTPGYLLSEGKVPEKLWLSGDKFGWRGPWGTTYGSNLRLFVRGMTEEEWVDTARTLIRRPTMPWFNLNAMNDEDLKAIYQFIRYLSPGGEPAPAYVPPDQEPKTPYALFPTPPK
jgi:mono/diheme cytochrome c family protein